jgi:hypothetical protein
MTTHCNMIEKATKAEQQSLGISNPTGRTDQVCMACGQAAVRHLTAA